MSVNKVIIIGRSVRDAEIRSTSDGREIANLTIVTSERWKDKQSGEKKEKAEFHKVICFNPNLTNVIKSYVKKGSKLYVEGSLQTRKWQDKSGKDNYSTEIVLQAFNGAVQLLDNRSETQDTHKTDYNQDNGDSNLDDEVPF